MAKIYVLVLLGVLLPLACESVTPCSPPKIPNGYSTCDNSPSIGVGAKCKVKCNEGFWRKGSGLVTCGDNNNDGKGDFKLPKCKKKMDAKYGKWSKLSALKCELPPDTKCTPGSKAKGFRTQTRTCTGKDCKYTKMSRKRGCTIKCKKVKFDELTKWEWTDECNRPKTGLCSGDNLPAESDKIVRKGERIFRRTCLGDNCDPSKALEKVGQPCYIRCRNHNDCYMPEVPNASRVCPTYPGNRPWLEVRKSCSFTCNDNFEMKGDATVFCKDKNNDFIGELTELPTCEKKVTVTPCAAPSIPNGVSTCDKSKFISFGAPCTVSCDDGFEMKGDASITCGDSDNDGKGDFVLPTCQVPHGGMMFNGDIFVYLPDKGYVTRQQAIDACKELGDYHLAYVKTPETMQAIWEYALPLKPKDWGSTQTWLWIDGTVVPTSGLNNINPIKWSDGTETHYAEKYWTGRSRLGQHNVMSLVLLDESWNPAVLAPGAYFQNIWDYMANLSWPLCQKRRAA